MGQAGLQIDLYTHPSRGSAAKTIQHSHAYPASYAGYLSSFDTHARRQPVKQSARSRRTCAKIGVYLGVKTCEVFLCFLAVIFLGSIVLISQWLLCSHCFMSLVSLTAEDKPKIGDCEHKGHASPMVCKLLYTLSSLRVDYE